jgi:hypothetical protein
MGYTHDTHYAQFISPFQYQKTAGTWTATLASNTVGDVRTAADAAFDLYIPILIPSNASALKGAMLTSIDVYWRCATAAMDAVATVELEKMTLPANASVVSGAAVTVTVDAANDTTAERLTLASHTMTVTVTTPTWSDDGECYWLYIACDAAATSVWTNWGAVAHFTLRN